MSGGKRPMQVDDLYKIITIEDPQISPDGQWVAFVRVTIDKLENTYKRNIWLKSTGDLEAKDAFQLSRSGQDFNPRWSPDGKTLAFVSTRAEKPQIYLLPLAAPGGEARALTSAPNGASSPRWSPDGTHIAYLARMNAEERAKEDAGEEIEPPQDQLEGKQRQERQEHDEKKRFDPYYMWRVPYRAGTSFLDDRYAQVYVMPVDETSEEAKPRRLTDIDADHQPVRWSPDGEFLYTGRQFDTKADEPFRQNVLYRIRVDDGESATLTDTEYTSFNPQPSPDGKWIMFTRRPGDRVDSLTHLAVMPAAGGDIRDLNLEFDRGAEIVQWSPDGDILFTAGNYGDRSLYRVKPEGGDVETVTSGLFQIRALDIGPNGEAAAVVSTPTSPSELYFMPAGETDLTPVTDFNQAFLDEVIVQETHEMRFENPHGQEIQGWYILPVGYQEGEKYPLALNIHGGPYVMWGPSETTMFHEWQFHAARGYVVFYCNPRGGEGYGAEFTKALHAAWGEVAFEDIMAGVDALLEKGFVDEDRMAVTGGSYGGYMTSWIVGHTDRFVSAVSQRGVYNLVSFYGTSDVPFLISAGFETEPWENQELLWKHSPLAYAHKIKTPILIIHAENDYRVPIEQGEQLFAYVRRSGGTTEMWRYPRDGHELSRSGEPEHRVSRLTKMIDWFDKYCLPEQD